MNRRAAADGAFVGDGLVRGVRVELARALLSAKDRVHAGGMMWVSERSSHWAAAAAAEARYRSIDRLIRRDCKENDDGDSVRSHGGRMMATNGDRWQRH